MLSAFQVTVKLSSQLGHSLPPDKFRRGLVCRVVGLKLVYEQCVKGILGKR